MKAIPEYSVSVRHPKFGWQVVAVCYTLNGARKAYFKWQRDTTWQVSLKKISGDQIWSVIGYDDRDGSRKFVEV